ncbi:MAG: ATP phosphoribosyltransferase regulatory subunit [Oscillospiraceae bacterium]|nr:ATP phosphoribosyltransferase regulatory subunit [Oscillospiraceae bacterium]
MKRFDKITPEGTRDILFRECDAKNMAQSAMEKIFRSHGFRQVTTPGVEFYDVFRGAAGYFRQEAMYKLTDHKGRLLVLRPDSTIPIARMTATKLQNEPLPLRLFYRQEVYRMSPAMSGRSDQISQCGAELIGAGGRRADLEMLLLADRCLAACTVEDVTLELGHIGLFQSLVSALEAAPEQKERLRDYMENKNYGGLDELLSRLPASREAEALRRLPRLFGGAEVFEEAAALCDNPEFCRVLGYLKELYALLEKSGLGSRLMMDFGMVHQAEYYTGILFRAYLKGAGEPVLSGGRYDSLLEDFQIDRPAIGFGANIDLLAAQLLAAGKPENAAPDLLLHALPGYELKAFRCAEEAVARGLCCENSLAESREDAVAFAKARGIPRIRFVGEALEDVEVEG